MGEYFLIQHVFFTLAIAGISAIGTLMLVRHLKAFDVPNERSSHVALTPRGGGIAIVAAFLAAILLINLADDNAPIVTPYFMGFLLSSCMIAVISLYDDFRTVSFRIKLAGQIVVVIFGMYAGIAIESVNLPLFGEVYLGPWAYPLTFFWMLGLTNAYNFIDGLDGLAAGTAVIAASFLAYISFQQGSQFIYLASLALAAAASGFLFFNWPPARIFMGDVGSTFLGFTFAVIAVIASRYDHSHLSLFAVPLLLFHFIFDTVFTFSRRLLSGEHVFTAHRSHLYQLLNRIGYSHMRVTLIYSALAVLQGAAAIWMVQGRGNEYIFLPFLVSYLICAKWLISKAAKAGIISLQRRKS